MICSFFGESRSNSLNHFTNSLLFGSIFSDSSHSSDSLFLLFQRRKKLPHFRTAFLIVFYEFFHNFFYTQCLANFRNDSSLVLPVDSCLHLVVFAVQVIKTMRWIIVIDQHTQMPVREIFNSLILWSRPILPIFFYTLVGEFVLFLFYCAHIIVDCVIQKSLFKSLIKLRLKLLKVGFPFFIIVVRFVFFPRPILSLFRWLFIRFRRGVLDRLFI